MPKKFTIRFPDPLFNRIYNFARREYRDPNFSDVIRDLVQTGLLAKHHERGLHDTLRPGEQDPLKTPTEYVPSPAEVGELVQHYKRAHKMGSSNPGAQDTTAARTVRALAGQAHRIAELEEELTRRAHPNP